MTLSTDTLLVSQGLEVSISATVDFKNKARISNLSMKLIVNKDFVLSDFDCFSLNTTCLN